MTTANSEKPAERIESINNGLPEGWKDAPLSDVGTITTGNTPPRKEPSNFGGTFPWVKPSDLDQFDPITKTQEYLSEKGAKKARLLPAKTTMVSCIGNLGKVGFAGTILATNQQINSITFYDGLVDGRYGFFYCKTLKGWLEDHASATTLSIINKQRFSEAPFLLPPLAEQKLIVAKVEELIARVNAARERLAKVKEILKHFRQSVLAAACSSRLTADWREKHPRVESAKEILNKIQINRMNQAVTSAQKEKFKDIYSYQEREDSKLLPGNWKYISLDKICESFQYGTSKKSQSTGKIPVLRMGNIQNGHIDWSDLVYTSDDIEIQWYKLRPGDVLFNRTNSPELVGKTAIYSGEQPAAFAGYLIRINNFEELQSEYLKYCLNTPYAKEFCLEVKTDGVSQSNINAQKLGKFEVPFCSKEEQKEIVLRVKVLFKLADQIEKRVATARERAERLAQATLAKAFRGELVPTEAELAQREGRPYEPACVLLEKTKARRIMERGTILKKTKLQKDKKISGSRL